MIKGKYWNNICTARPSWILYFEYENLARVKELSNRSLKVDTTIFLLKINNLVYKYFFMKTYVHYNISKCEQIFVSMIFHNHIFKNLNLHEHSIHPFIKIYISIFIPPQHLLQRHFYQLRTVKITHHSFG